MIGVLLPRERICKSDEVFAGGHHPHPAKFAFICVDP
jgi:hypothetical protein